jgi:hypothetical protein
MTLKSYIWGIRLVALVSLIVLGLVTFYVNPESQDIAGKVFFYLTLFFFLSGIFNLMMLKARERMMRDGGILENISLSFRQGVLLAMMAIGLLILQSLRALVWWDASLVVAGIFLIELYFLSRN